MKVKELMERVGAESLPTGRAIAYIKDGLEELNTISETHVTTSRMNLIENKRFYKFPNDMVKLLSIRCKNHLNSKSEYRKIPRLVYEPNIVDNDGV